MAQYGTTIFLSESFSGIILKIFALSLKVFPYSPCMSIKIILEDGKTEGFIRIFTNPATVVDLPVPVEPTIQLCLDTNLLIFINAGIFSAPDIVPTCTNSAPCSLPYIFIRSSIYLLDRPL